MTRLTRSQRQHSLRVNALPAAADRSWVSLAMLKIPPLHKPGIAELLAAGDTLPVR